MEIKARVLDHFKLLDPMLDKDRVGGLCSGMILPRNKSADPSKSRVGDRDAIA